MAGQVGSKIRINCQTSYRAILGTDQHVKKNKNARVGVCVCVCLHVEEVPSGSTDLANIRASEVAKSTLAGVTARMRQVSLVVNCMIMSRI